jgi:hypothetical protein
MGWWERRGRVALARCGQKWWIAHLPGGVAYLAYCPEWHTGADARRYEVQEGVLVGRGARLQEVPA